MTETPKGTPDAVICFHTSNRTIDLAGAIAAVARECKADFLVGHYDIAKRKVGGDPHRGVDAREAVDHASSRRKEMSIALAECVIAPEET